MYLSESLGLINYQRGVKIDGKGMWVYRDNGAVLEWALLNYFMQDHLRDLHSWNSTSTVPHNQLTQFETV